MSAEPTTVETPDRATFNSGAESNSHSHGHIDPILTVAEIASELRCSQRHVRRLLNGKIQGVTRLPHLSLGRKKVVQRSHFERWKNINVSDIIPDHSNKVEDAMHSTKENGYAS